MKIKWFNHEFRLAAVERARTCESIPELARELGVHNSQIYRWMRIYEEQGPEALAVRAGRVIHSPFPPPPADAQGKISELERKIGQQAVDMDFLKRAFKRVKESRPNSGSSGATASTK
jgi:transposase